MTTKICNICKQEKDIHEFHNLFMSRDGHKDYCRKCAREMSRARYEKQKIRILTANAKWRKENPERFKYLCKRNKTREEERVYLKKWRQANPKKYHAHNRIQILKNQKKLTPPSACSVCGCAGKLNAHHDDYSKPEDVRWLCIKCHAQEHAILKEAINA